MGNIIFITVGWFLVVGHVLGVFQAIKCISSPEIVEKPTLKVLAYAMLINVFVIYWIATATFKIK